MYPDHFIRESDVADSFGVLGYVCCSYWRCSDYICLLLDLAQERFYHNPLHLAMHQPIWISPQGLAPSRQSAWELNPFTARGQVQTLQQRCAPTRLMSPV